MRCRGAAAWRIGRACGPRPSPRRQRRRPQQHGQARAGREAKMCCWEGRCKGGARGRGGECVDCARRGIKAAAAFAAAALAARARQQADACAGAAARAAGRQAGRKIAGPQAGPACDRHRRVPQSTRRQAARVHRFRRSAGPPAQRLCDAPPARRINGPVPLRHLRRPNRHHGKWRRILQQGMRCRIRQPPNDRRWAPAPPAAAAKRSSHQPPTHAARATNAAIAYVPAAAAPLHP